MALAAKMSPFSGVRRQAERQPLQLDATMRELGTEWSDVRIHNVSTHGFMVESDEDFRVDSYVWLSLPGFSRLSAQIMWRDSFRYGCMFTAPISREQLEAARAADDEAEAA